MLIICFVIEWSPYSVMYIWPIFNDIENLPMRLGAVGPLLAKFAVVTTPLIYFNDGKKLKSKET